jgi:hypothetical protein
MCQLVEKRESDPMSDAPIRATRYPLLLPLRVWIRGIMRGFSSRQRPSVAAEETITENISSTGCYFLLNEEPRVGTKVEMEIVIPATADRRETGKILCRGKVVRIERERSQGKTGVACTIDHYRLISGSRPK